MSWHTSRSSEPQDWDSESSTPGPGVTPPGKWGGATTFALTSPLSSMSRLLQELPRGHRQTFSGNTPSVPCPGWTRLDETLGRPDVERLERWEVRRKAAGCSAALSLGVPRKWPALRGSPLVILWATSCPSAHWSGPDDYGCRARQ